MRRRFASLCLTAFLVLGTGKNCVAQPQLPPYLQQSYSWTDSVLKTLTLKQKIGQLIMVACWSRDMEREKQRVGELVQKHHVGGIIFMQGGPVRQVLLTNYLQEKARVPLLIAMDAEWGLSMRLDSVLSFPRQMMLAATRDTVLAYAFGKEMARQLKRVGVHLSFSPVVDVNNNPMNPVIGDRSFGEDPQLVAAMGRAYMKGLQDHGVLACAKHFPGHGNTDQDSHYTLPVIHATLSSLQATELVPFHALISAGVGSVMVAHIALPQLSQSQWPASIAPQVVTDLLRNKIGYGGLVITDALNMKGVTSVVERGHVELRALLAGNDILLFSEHVGKAIEMIYDAVQNHLISEAEIDQRVRRILQAKYWCGLARWQPISVSGLADDLHHPEALLLQQRIAEKAMTLVRNPRSLIPLHRLDTFRLASVVIGAKDPTPFQSMLSKFAPVQHFSLPAQPSSDQRAWLQKQLAGFNGIFVSVMSVPRQATASSGFFTGTLALIDSLQRSATVFLTLFHSPYALHHVKWDLPILVAYQSDGFAQKAAAQVWFGGIASSGRLPVSASTHFTRGVGITTKITRLHYTIPEELGLSSFAFRRIDSLIYGAIRQMAMPGCQLWVALRGHVIWSKNYGNATYDTIHPVRDESIYDLASITKIAATTLMIMKLWEEGKLDLNQEVSHYVPAWRQTEVGSLRLYELLTHQAGMKPFIPFYRKTLSSDGNLDTSIFSKRHSGLFSVPVTEKLFMNRTYLDTIWSAVVNTPLQNRGRYLYSDLGFYVLQRVAELVAQQSLDQFVFEHIYLPLGLSTMSFNPLRFFEPAQMIPSGFDYVFRKQRLQGTVHDPGAALLGGVAGHAGLFSNANDLGIVMYMLLNGGQYGETTYFKPSTIDMFTRRYSQVSRRALGFDRPETTAGRSSPTAAAASERTFGHTGFTGTCAWADPAHGLVYVFLSNRTFPDETNTRLNSLNLRIRIQELIYEMLPEK